ncbi:hypothetical protein [Paracidovorax konjaci]|uniref:hypothetical protein n=1 Tax=Paracidovorax konjaci TaxID=32040 RepID=UPI0011139EC3|nr:hypothetical protein [Paracidovorax konjaci]
MEILVFSSSTQTNIWAGYGAECWAVSSKQAANASLRTRAQNIKLGKFGILYCVETKSVTMPFVVTSSADMSKVIANIWPQPWELPFNLKPIASPAKSIATSVLGGVLALAPGITWNKVLHVGPSTAFAPSSLTDAQWSALISGLV